jgi:hypothetical protein
MFSPQPSSVSGSSAGQAAAVAITDPSPASLKALNSFWSGSAGEGARLAVRSTRGEKEEALVGAVAEDRREGRRSAGCGRNAVADTRRRLAKGSGGVAL